MTPERVAGWAPATVGGLARLADLLIGLVGSPSVGVDGPEAADVSGALLAEGLPADVIDGSSRYDVVVSLGDADGSAVDDARALVAHLTGLANLAIVFTPRLNDGRSNQWWDDLFASVGFEAADVLRASLWDDPAWDSRGLTGLTLYVRQSEPSIVEGLEPSAVPRSAVHPGMLEAAQRAELRAHQLVDRFDLYDPAVDDAMATLEQALERSARDAEARRREMETAVAEAQAELDRLRAETSTIEAARTWEADSRARAVEALARAKQESELLRFEINELMTASPATMVKSSSAARLIGQRAVAAAMRRLQRRGLQLADRLTVDLPGRPGVYSRRAIAMYRTITIDWLEVTRELFDTDHYLAQRPGLVGSGVDPVVHYSKVGWRQGLDPHPLFDTAWYLRTNRSLLPADTSPLEHFVSHGWREGCSPHPLFDTDFYLRRAVHVAVAGEIPLVHYLREGWREGRDPHPIFQTRRYLDDHPEVKASGQCPLVHYVMLGWQLGYRPGDSFDPEWYVEQHPEANFGGLPPYRYFLEIGVRRGDRPSRPAE